MKSVEQQIRLLRLLSRWMTVDSAKPPLRSSARDPGT
jgi:hypothetical protein